MRISINQIEKFRIIESDKLYTVQIDSNKLICKFKPYNNQLRLFTNIRKIFVNKWIEQFKILYINDEIIFEFWNKAEIKEKLMINNKWLFRGLIAIYNRQTLDEQDTNMTRNRNSVGFNGVDAFFLTKMAKLAKTDYVFSVRQIEVIRRMMLKYAGQLLKIAQSKI
jgi:hypothetical protein